jgi:hypothetical protein
MRKMNHFPTTRLNKVLKTITNSLFVLAATTTLLLTTNGSAQTQNVSQDTPQSKGTPVVFETLEVLKAMNPQTFVPKTFYYGNANDDPAATPTVGEEGETKYIKICSTGGNPPKMADTISKLYRWVKIPDNAPKEIAIEFKSKITKTADFDWQTTEGSKDPDRRNEIIVSFMKEDGTTGGGIKISRENLRKIDQWVTHTHSLKIPEGAKYLQIGMETSGAYCLWLGDWKIK